MRKPRICAVIIDGDVRAVKAIEPFVDLFEVRMDLIGAGWRKVVKRLDKPWLACNRSTEQGGKAERDRLEHLFEAVELGAKIVDLESGKKEDLEIVPRIKKRARCLLSYHDFRGTPSLEKLKTVAEGQMKAGADICKVVTTAKSLANNWTVLQLVVELREKTGIVSFAMGEEGVLSRVLCPLVGGYFTYASVERGKESAPGQMTVRELARLYEMMRR